MANKIIPYNRSLKIRARELRKNMTPAEILVWKNIRKKSLGVEFHRQVPILNYIVDFYCHEIGLALEIDGKIHNDNFLEDSERQGEIEKYGVSFLRFSNHEVFNDIDSVKNKINTYIIEFNQNP